MHSCQDELDTCHHLGVGHGYGPVDHYEEVALAVFRSSSVTTLPTRPELRDFDTKQLRTNNFSIARIKYAKRDVLVEKVVEPGAPKGTFVGLSVAEVTSLREITIAMIDKDGKPAPRERAICVIDRVEPDDYDAHAVLGFSASVETGSQTRIGLQRRAAVELLMAQFSDLLPIEHELFADARASPGGSETLSVNAVIAEAEVDVANDELRK